MKFLHYFTALILLSCFSPAKSGNGITVTILYDNTTVVEHVQADWGFACLVEGLEKTILFDTGTKSDVLLHNAQVLGKDLTQVDVLVLSHDHRDHTGAMTTILELNPGLVVYFPRSFPALYDTTIRNYDAQAIRVAAAIEIFAGVALTGELGSQIMELSLILETKAGPVIITGCSHPGIVRILEHTAKLHRQGIHLVLGGFHLLEHTDDQVNTIIAHFRELGVEKVGATHCTGEQAIKQFQQAYGDEFVPVGAGRIVEITR